MKMKIFNYQLLITFLLTGVPVYGAELGERLLKIAQTAATEREKNRENLFCAPQSEGCQVSSNFPGGGLSQQAGEILENACSDFASVAKDSDMTEVPDGFRQTRSHAGSAFLRSFNNSMQAYKEHGGKLDLKSLCLTEAWRLAFIDTSNLDSIVRGDIKASLEEAKYRAVKSSTFYSSPAYNAPQVAPCSAGDKNCYFFQPPVQDDCDLLGCTAIGSGGFSQNEGFTGLADHFVLTSKNTPLSGTSNFCASCYERAYKQTPELGQSKSFQDAQKELNERVKDNLASKLVAKKMLKWIDHLETMKSLEYTASGLTDNKDLTCKEEVSPYVTMGGNPCGDDLPSSRAIGRIGRAVDHLGLIPGMRVNDVLTAINEKIDPVGENESSCREAYAYTQKLTMENVDNQKHMDGFKYLSNLALERPEFATMLDEKCSSAEPPKESFVEAYAAKMADYYVPIIREAQHNSEKAKKLCDQDPLLGAFICGKEDEKAGLSADTTKFFHEIHQEIQEGLDTVAKRELFNRSIEKQREVNQLLLGSNQSSPIPSPARAPGQLDTEFYIRTFYKNVIQSQIESIFNVPMELTPLLKVNYGSWDNICAAKARVDKGEASTLNDAMRPSRQNSLSDKLDTYTKETCGQIKKDLHEALCGNIPLPTESGFSNGVPYSLEDLRAVVDEVKDYAKSQKDQIVTNSLRCSLKNESEETTGIFYAPKYDTMIGEGAPAKLSDFEQGLVGKGAFKAYREASQCAEVESVKAAAFGVAAYTGNNEALASFASREGRLKISAVTSGQHRLAEPEDSDTSLAESVVQVTHSAKDVKKTNGDKGDSGISDSRGGEVGFGGAGMAIDMERIERLRLEEPKRSPASDDSFEVGMKDIEEFDSSAQLEKASDSVSLDSGQSGSGEYESLFGYLEEQPGASAGFGQTGIDFYSNQFGSLAAGPKPEEVCDDACIQELIASASKQEQPEQVAEKVGLIGFGSSTEEMRAVLSDVLDGKLNDEDLAKLREENQKLREEMAAIRERLLEKDKPVKVLDSNGVDRTDMVEKPELNPNVVYNPRNTQVAEFRSRSFYDDKREQFAPDYNASASSVPPERMSLGSYSAQRRAAATSLPVEKLREYNTEADRTFLRANTSSTVDDNYVREYVESVGKTSGTIEHLIIYENGRPAKIRVPDPKNPGDYVETPLDDHMVGEILEQVEKDEMESYALFNMVNFGQSLGEFMQGLEVERSDLTTLSSLNERLSEARGLEQR